MLAFLLMIWLMRVVRLIGVKRLAVAMAVLGAAAMRIDFCCSARYCLTARAAAFNKAKDLL